MKRVSRGKVEHVLSLLLITACAILLGVTPVTAQEAPPPLFDIVTLWQGQTASVSVSQETAYGFHAVFVTSIGNTSLTGSLGFSDKDTLGWWTVLTIGTGGRTFIDFGFGLLPWGAGEKATVDIGGGVSYGLILTNVFATKLPADGNLGYTITVGP